MPSNNRSRNKYRHRKPTSRAKTDDIQAHIDEMMGMGYGVNRYHIPPQSKYDFARALDIDKEVRLIMTQKSEFPLTKRNLIIDIYNGSLNR